MNLTRFITSLRTMHLLSLDVVMGALFCYLMFARLPNGHHPIDWATPILLALGVFIVYTLDRLLDIRYRQIISPRHQFHQQHASLLWRILVGCGVIGTFLLFFLPQQILWLGIGITTLTGLYLWLVNRLSASSIFQAQKEFVVALLYTGGVWGSVAVMQPELNWVDWGYGFIFLLIVSQNLLLFSWMEAFQADEANSLAILWGDETCRRVITIIFVLILGLVVGLLFFVDYPYQRRVLLSLLLMSAILLYIRYNPDTFLTHEHYRWVGDGVFVLSLLML